jgi:hypothetical protein
MEHGSGPESTKAEGGVVKRRGLLAVAAALIGRTLARLVKPEPVEAGHDGTNIFHLGATNAAAATTTLAATGAGTVGGMTVTNSAGRGLVVESSAGFFGLRVTSTSASAVSASATDADGIEGASTDGTGVFGISTNGSGILGQSTTGDGVTAFSSTGIGVFSQASADSAVRGEVTGSSNAIAIYGVNNSSFAGPGPGAGGFAVYGLSAMGHGLVGATAAAGGAAVVGATNGVAGAWAAAFYGPVIVGGDLLVVGGAKAPRCLTRTAHIASSTASRARKLVRGFRHRRACQWTGGGRDRKGVRRRRGDGHLPCVSNRVRSLPPAPCDQTHAERVHGRGRRGACGVNRSQGE